MTADPATAQTPAFFVPASNYRGAGVSARERENLWPKTWQIVCREEEIPNVGDFVNYELVDESILVTRVTVDRVSAYYNACQHRGRQLREEPRGNAAQGFYCRFHGWRYNLNGALTFAYGEKDWSDCPALKDGSLNLKQPLVGHWGGWIWINMDPDAQPLLDYLDPLPRIFRNFALEDMRLTWWETLIAPVNWKVVVEAFNEGYHSGATHNARVDYRPLQASAQTHGLHSTFTSTFSGLTRVRDEEGRWTDPANMIDMIYHQSKELHDTLGALVAEPMMRALTRWRAEVPADASVEAILGRLWEMHREEVEATGAIWPADLTPMDLAEAGTLWHIFPNTIVLPSADGVLWYRMRPHASDDDQCVFDIWCLRRYAPGQAPEITNTVTDGFEAFAGRNAFLEQDFSNMRAVSRGMKSRGWTGAFTNPDQEKQVPHFHRMLHDYMDR